VHDIEPHYKWRNKYVAAEDKDSPFYGKQYSEFYFTHRIYNYVIHPQWDDFGAHTLFIKILFVDYLEGYAIMELIGEWNDCLHNDIMFLKNNIIDHLAEHKINKYIIISEQVLNFHAGEDDYYQEWQEELLESEGWACLINALPHVEQEFKDYRLHQIINLDEGLSDLNWRILQPEELFALIESICFPKYLEY
jgi:hypothetical protein